MADGVAAAGGLSRDQPTLALHMSATPPSSLPDLSFDFDFIYGTAWKEERTAALTELAIRAGFRAIDTANQRRHYFEEGVGQGLSAAYRAGIVSRADLFFQTKFTYQGGQDHRLPYDPAASFSEQVAQSMASSLEHLGTHTWTAMSCTVPHPAMDGRKPMPRCGRRCAGSGMPGMHAGLE